MNRRLAQVIGCAGLALLAVSPVRPEDRFINRFDFRPSDLTITRAARPQTPFDKVGRKFAILGTEDGRFEAWAYPLKLLRDFELSFFIGSSTRPIAAADIVRSIEVSPAVTTLTYVFQSFTVRASFIAAFDDPGAVVLLSVDSTEPLTIVCGFLPVLQPMWPAGIGGQYAYWDDTLKAYLISEPRRRDLGLIGSPAGEGISYTPAHMLSDTPNEFKIAIPDPKAAAGKFIPIVLAGGHGDREAVTAVYKRLAADPEAVWRKADEHFRSLRDGTLRVTTSDRELDLAFEWGKVAHDNLLVDNPDLGRGLVAGLGASGSGGRPGFGWFFGTDAFFNSLSLDGTGAWDTVRTALAFLRQRQRADGKIMHELSQAAGYVDWFKDYPYGYIHADTTPYDIVAVRDYVLASGDVPFLRESWPSLKKAFDYCLSTDANGDGLMDNRKAGLGALEFGSLTGIETDIYLAAVWVEACRAMDRLSAVIQDNAAQAKARGAADKAERALESKFWDETLGQYSYGFNADGARVPEITPWSAVPVFWGQGTPGHARRTLERLNRGDITVDWGIRMMSEASRYYEPLNYNYGACWPFLAGYVSTALFRNNLDLQGYTLLRATARHTFDNDLGCLTELFSGQTNVWPQEAVPHQGFSTSGVTLPLVRGLLGLSGDALAKEVEFAPRLPGQWPGVTVENFRVGAERLSLKVERTVGHLRLECGATDRSGWTMTFSPLVPGCEKVERVLLNGRDASFEATAGAYPVQPILKFALTGSDVVEVDFVPGPDWLAPDIRSRTGDSSGGLRFVGQGRTGQRLTAELEGLAGATYGIGILNPDRVASVEGGEFKGGVLTVSFPAGPAGAYVRRSVALIAK